VTLSGHVVITGGASGIGEAAAVALLDEGVAVTVLDANRDTVARMEDRFEGEDIAALTCDVTDEDEVAERLTEAAAAFGPLTGLVNCAGIARDLPAEKTPVETFRQILDVNLTGSFILCQTALEHMGDRLSIVNIASVSGLRANAGRVAYGASKAGVVLMSQVLATEWGGHGVRVNVIAPGPIDSPMVSVLHTAEDRKVWTSRTPMRRYGNASEVAAAILFLLSDEASYINGHVLAVDGGFLAAGILPEG
jgi:3-oxoacyl-[acyl-carrier protein] reductase